MSLSKKQQDVAWELSAILMDHVNDPDKARRVAELMEFFDSGSQLLSVGWWRKAADLGDEDARSYLAELIEEGVAERRQND